MPQHPLLPVLLRRLRPSRARVAAAAGLVVALAASAEVARAHYLPGGLTLPGLTIGGTTVPSLDSEAALRAWVAARAQALQAREVDLVVAGASQPTDHATLGELGVTVDVDRVVARARGAGHTEDLLERAERARRARDGALDVPLDAAVDPELCRARLQPIKDAEDRAPVSARLDLEHQGIVPERDGRYIDADGAALAIARIAAAEAHPGEAEALPSAVTLPVATIPPRFTSAYVATIDAHALMSEYETYFSRRGDQARRGANIDVAASKLDGLVLMPGEMFSFNAIVGERSEENGFQKSWEILKGEMIEGVGGGTCQVASTLHAIAFFGGLDVLERLPHSRPSAYIPMGLDATVVYPEVDLKLRNPHPFPVVVQAKVDGNRLHMALYGVKKPAAVSFKRELLETFPFTRKVEEDDTLRGRHVLVKQHGIRGFKIKRTRTLAFRDGRTRKEETTDKYPPTTEIYEVPPGFDVALLPPLPVMDGDEGEGSDTSAQAAADASRAGEAIATVPPPAASAVACSGDCARPADVRPPDVALVFADAPGAHRPTEAQARPPRTFSIRR
jgi:vancomycin resistance protein YoaR